MALEPRYKVDELTVVMSQDNIVKRIEQIESEILTDERSFLLGFLDFDHAQPYLKEGVKIGEWEPDGDTGLREAFHHYKDWWGQKVRDGRGISVHRGRANVTALLFLSGIEGWELLRDMDGGWYQEDAYNWTADLFGWPHQTGERT